MEVLFHGAAREVTGACFLVRCAGHRLLLDCGLIQGAAADEARNREPFPFDAAAIDAVVLSHAHLDHSGRLPLLVNAGFRGPVYTHAATRDLCDILLRDAAHLSEKDAELENRKRARKGKRPLAPLYTRPQAERAMRQFRALAYGEERVRLRLDALIEDLAGRLDRDESQVDPLDLDLAVPQRLHAVVRAAGEGQPKLAHNG